MPLTEDRCSLSHSFIYCQLCFITLKKRLFVVACEPTCRDKIRAGLEELRMVQPGGDTFMDRGFHRVRNPIHVGGDCSETRIYGH